MADENMPPKAEILPPNRQLGRRMPDWVRPALVTGGCTVGGGALAVWAFNWFLQSRGYQSMNGSRVFLAIAYLGTAIVAFGLTRRLRRYQNRWFVICLVLLALAAAGFDRLIPMAQVLPLSSSSTHTRPSDWRTIKDWQKAELAPTLEQFPNSTLRIVVTSSAPDETLDYAQQFKDFFGKHKWNVIGPETDPTDQIAENIHLSISEQYWGKPAPTAFGAIDGAMRFVGIKRSPNFVSDSLVSPAELVMWIGPETPPGFPEHIPLRLSTTCQRPLQFTDDTMHFFGHPNDFVRWVRIKPPTKTHFLAGQKLLVVLTGPAKSVAASEQFSVQSLGTVMPRPDALDVTVTKELKDCEPLALKIISDKELRVKCVADRPSR